MEKHSQPSNGFGRKSLFDEQLLVTHRTHDITDFINESEFALN